MKQFSRGPFYVLVHLDVRERGGQSYLKGTGMPYLHVFWTKNNMDINFCNEYRSLKRNSKSLVVLLFGVSYFPDFIF